MKSILGRKVGMTQVFATDGIMVPVTVIEVLPNVVLQKKTKENDGYDALQLGIEDKKESSSNKAEKGHAAKANTTPKQYVAEVQGDEMLNYNLGDVISVDIFKAGEAVDVIGVTKGKGFSGGIKRWGFKKGPAAHGASLALRKIGSLATSGRTNNRVHPGRPMSGHHGNYTRTILNLEVVAVDASKNAILIKGAIPGANRGLVTIRTAVKVQKSKAVAKTLANYTAE